MLLIHGFSYRIINDWNGLLNSIGKVNTINAFKFLLEDQWKDADFKFNFKGHVYVPKRICVRFNDIHLLFLISAFL